jgi:hypothetical protein
MTDSEGSLLRTLLPVIAGGLIIFLVTTLYTEVWKKPEVALLTLPPNPIHRDTLKFVNVGRSPADNLRITISSPDIWNVVNFTMGPHTQNTTLSEEGGRWIIETRRFPVGASVSVNPVLKSLSKPTPYFIDIASDQGVTGGTLEVIPVNNNTQRDLIPPNPFPVDIRPIVFAFYAAVAITVVYVLSRIREKSRLRNRDKYLKKINDEIYRYYTKHEESKDVRLKMLDSLRNDVRTEFNKRRIKRSDFELLEDKILEHIRNMNKDSSYHDAT